jgi:hypothetical protein
LAPTRPQGAGPAARTTTSWSRPSGRRKGGALCAQGPAQGEAGAVTTTTDAVVVARTLSWVERAVVGLELCPYAATPLRSGAVRVAVSRATDERGVIDAIREECSHLAATHEETVATTLVVLPDYARDFASFPERIIELEDDDAFASLYPEFAALAMVICFHPEFTWEGLPESDPVNFERRAPFPIVNLLRTEMVDEAILSGRTESIITRNEARLRREGIGAVRALFAELSQFE